MLKYKNDNTEQGISGTQMERSIHQGQCYLRSKKEQIVSIRCKARRPLRSRGLPSPYKGVRRRLFGSSSPDPPPKEEPPCQEQPVTAAPFDLSADRSRSPTPARPSDLLYPFLAADAVWTPSHPVIQQAPIPSGLRDSTHGRSPARQRSPSRRSPAKQRPRVPDARIARPRSPVRSRAIDQPVPLVRQRSSSRPRSPDLDLGKGTNPSPRLRAPVRPSAPAQQRAKASVRECSSTSSDVRGNLTARQRSPARSCDHSPVRERSPERPRPSQPDRLRPPTRLLVVRAFVLLNARDIARHRASVLRRASALRLANTRQVARDFFRVLVRATIGRLVLSAHLHPRGLVLLHVRANAPSCPFAYAPTRRLAHAPASVRTHAHSSTRGNVLARDSLNAFSREDRRDSHSRREHQRGQPTGTWTSRAVSGSPPRKRRPRGVHSEGSEDPFPPGGITDTASVTRQPWFHHIMNAVVQAVKPALVDMGLKPTAGSPPLKRRGVDFVVTSPRVKLAPKRSVRRTPTRAISPSPVDVLSPSSGESSEAGVSPTAPMGGTPPLRRETAREDAPFRTSLLESCIPPRREPRDSKTIPKSSSRIRPKPTKPQEDVHVSPQDEPLGTGDLAASPRRGRLQAQALLHYWEGSARAQRYRTNSREVEEIESRFSPPEGPDISALQASGTSTATAASQDIEAGSGS
ncbi:serine/arginine repetitive matrix protein 1-like [Palaemon carinicauda]|uniref:serine/arginine repetitive matrix protein 1-like n=1 Tax=Palaemon carinicauda TaxID=392227 RepID=UPI0035B63819